MIKNIKNISSLDADPGLEPYRTLKRPLAHRKQGVFIAEGSKVVERFLESHIVPLSFLLTAEWFELLKRKVEARTELIELFIAEKKLLETIVGFECHQGVMALGKVPPPVPLEKVISSLPSPRLLVAVDGLVSAENTGVLLRNCAACGVGAFIAGGTSADPWLRRSVRNSMGTIFDLPVVYADNLTDTLRALRLTHKCRTLAAHPRAESGSLFDTDLTKDCCLVFGNEGNGISEAVVNACDCSIMVPMASGVDSFNVACASAVMLCEAVRQRTTAGLFHIIDRSAGPAYVDTSLRAGNYRKPFQLGDTSRG